METLADVLPGLFGAEAPLAGVGVAAAAVCALWALGALAWTTGRLVCRRRVAAPAAAPREALLLAPDAQEVETEAGVDIRILRRSFPAPFQTVRRLEKIEDIGDNQPVMVRAQNGKVFRSHVIAAREGELRIAAPFGNEPLPNHTMRLEFSRPHDARYEVGTRVAGAQGGDAILLKVTSHLRRIQQRRGYRVRCRGEATYGIAASHTGAERGRLRRKGDLPLTARMVDISTGGGAFVGDKDLAEGERLILRIPATLDSPALCLSARVIRQRLLAGTSLRKLKTSVVFVDPSPADEIALGRYVAGLQHEIMRRITERLAAPALPPRRFQPVATLERPSVLA